ncbi:unnamed protein product, partial [Sphagnum tenellum]
MATDCCDCCCFFLRRSRKDPKPTTSHLYKHYSGEHLLAFSVAEEDRLTHSSARHGAKSTFNNYCLPSDNNASIRIGYNRSMSPSRAPFKEWRGSPRIPQFDNMGENLAQHMLVKENNLAVLSQDSNGNKMINEYVRECKIGTGSYGKVVLHRSKKDGKQYAIKMFHKSRLRKLRVSPTETAMMDVLREVAIMKQLDHPNVVHLVEVIDDPENDRFYMVLEYAEGGWIFEGSGPTGGIGDAVSQRYLRDVVAGLMYLHQHNVIHGDIKPENLLIGGDGRIKICDFGVSCLCEDDNDEIGRSPGTPVFTAPECCLGLTYHGKAADIWALGCTLYCMVLGCYPFKGETLQSTYEKIVYDPLYLPEDLNPDLADLLKGLLCKDPTQRFSLEVVANHPWVVMGYGPVDEDLASCETEVF